MEHQFSIIDLAQKNFLGIHEGLTIEQLNKVPDGFNNNLIWNYAHIIASTQMLCYARPGLPVKLDETFVHAYKIGTKPEKFVTIEEYNRFQELADEGLTKLIEDYRGGYFKDFTPFVTGSGIPMNSIEFVITYVVFHNGMHQGCSTAIKKLVV